MHGNCTEIVSDVEIPRGVSDPNISWAKPTTSDHIIAFHSSRSETNIMVARSPNRPEVNCASETNSTGDNGTMKDVDAESTGSEITEPSTLSNSDTFPSNTSNRSTIGEAATDAAILSSQESKKRNRGYEAEDSDSEVDLTGSKRPKYPPISYDHQDGLSDRDDSTPNRASLLEIRLN